MEKETMKMIEALASKLGTTTEYLWSVLIKQAFVSSVIDLVLYFILILLTYGLYRFHKYANTKIDLGNGRRPQTRYDESEFYLIFASSGLAILSIVWIVAFFSISSTITGFINPEYWALERVLNSIK